MRFATIALFLTLVFLSSAKLKAQDTCSFVDPEAAGVLPPPPLEQYCEDEEGNTIFYQFQNINFGSYCDMGSVSNGVDEYGNVIDNSEIRLYEYMEALLDACARDTLCHDGYYNTGQQAITIPFSEFCVDPNCNQMQTPIGINNQSPSGPQYQGSDLDHHFDRFKWTANYGKTLLPDPTTMCTGSFCGKWLIDDFELIDIGNIEMEVTYKLACCPCGSGGTDLPPDDKIGNGNE